MDPTKYTFIAHRGMAHCNPISPAKADQVIELLSLARSDRVLDVGCGKAELLIRILERYGCRGLGVDRSTSMIRAAVEEASHRGVADRLELLESDAAQLGGEPGGYAAASCLGASDALGGFQAALERLAAWVRPGGLVLIGEGYWQREPAAEYLAAFGATRDDYLTHAGCVGAGVSLGLVPYYAVTSTTDEWDRYEWLHARNVELFAVENPGDPDVPALLSRRRAWRDLYLTWGRETLGFGLYLFRKPG